MNEDRQFEMQKDLVSTYGMCKTFGKQNLLLRLVKKIKLRSGWVAVGMTKKLKRNVEAM